MIDPEKYKLTKKQLKELGMYYKREYIPFGKHEPSNILRDSRLITEKYKNEDDDLLSENRVAIGLCITMIGRQVWEYKHEQAIDKRKASIRNWIQFWIPVGISFIALIVSIIALARGQQ